MQLSICMNIHFHFSKAWNWETWLHFHLSICHYYWNPCKLHQVLENIRTFQKMCSTLVGKAWQQEQGAFCSCCSCCYKAKRDEFTDKICKSSTRCSRIHFLFFSWLINTYNCLPLQEFVFSGRALDPYSPLLTIQLCTLLSKQHLTLCTAYMYFQFPTEFICWAHSICQDLH